MTTVAPTFQQMELEEVLAKHEQIRSECGQPGWDSREPTKYVSEETRRTADQLTRALAEKGIHPYEVFGKWGDYIVHNYELPWGHIDEERDSQESAGDATTIIQGSVIDLRNDSNAVWVKCSVLEAPGKLEEYLALRYD